MLATRAALVTVAIGLIGCTKTPEQVVTSYLGATSWEQRLTFVRKPDRVRPLMAKRYKDYKGPAKYVAVEKVEPRTGKPGWAYVKVVFQRGKNAFGGDVEQASLYQLEDTPDGYKIDWESSVGHNPLTWAAFSAQRPTNGTKMRVFAKLDDYYNYDFSGTEYAFYSVRVESQEQPGASLYAYIRKTSPDGQQLYDLLKDGEVHRIIGVFRFGPYSRGNTMLFEKFLQAGWVEDL